MKALALFLLLAAPLCAQDYFLTAGATYSHSTAAFGTLGARVVGNTYGLASTVAFRHNTYLLLDAAQHAAQQGHLGLWITGGLGVPLTTQQLAQSTPTINPGAFFSVSWKCGLFAHAGARILIPIGAATTPLGVRVDIQPAAGIGWSFKKP
jgi:hypothetical protein